MLRFALFGLFHGSNLGNEATLEAALAALRARAPEADVIVIAPGRSLLPARYGARVVDIDPYPLREWYWRLRPAALRAVGAHLTSYITEPARRRKASTILGDGRTLIAVGTGLVDDFGQGSMGLPLQLFRWTRAALAANAPVVVSCVGVETVKDGSSRRRFAQALRSATSRSYRDRASLEESRRLGIDVSSDVIAPDIALGLDPARYPLPAKTRGQARVIGIGLMGYTGWNEPAPRGAMLYERYVGKIASIIEWLLGRRFSVRLLVGDLRADAQVVPDVVKLVNRLRPGAADSLRYSPPREPTELISQIASVDALIATRFHNVLLGMWAGKPTISIGYSRKNAEILRDAGLPRFHHEIESFEPEDVKAQFDQLLLNADEIRDQLLEWRDSRREALQQTFDGWIEVAARAQVTVRALTSHTVAG